MLDEDEADADEEEEEKDEEEEEEEAAESISPSSSLSSSELSSPSPSKINGSIERCETTTGLSHKSVSNLILKVLLVGRETINEKWFCTRQ